MYSWRYILDENGKPIPEPDLLKWAQWFEDTKQRVVQQDHIGDIFVSTVFLGLDHAFVYDDVHEPVLWETMIFKDTDWSGDFQRRYTSLNDAIAGHMEAVEMVKANDKSLKELERMLGDWSR